MKRIRLAKKRFEKVYITEQAIKKVPYIEYTGIEPKQCRIIQALAKEVLEISQQENNSNEVAITYKMSDTNEIEYGISLGDEHSVLLESDTFSNHLLQSTAELKIVVLHNHPSPQTLSYDDMCTFFLYPNIKMMVAVTNQGTINFAIKDEYYDYRKARLLMIKYAQLIEKAIDENETYQITKKLLKESKRIGVHYR